MFDTQSSRRTESAGKQTTTSKKSNGTKQPLQRTTAPTPLPAYTQLMGTQPASGLRLGITAQSPRNEEHAEPMQKKENNTGLPDTLKTGVENLSGISMDDVHVHYNSPKPAEVQALAYIQGTEIYVGPGQERHLAHEAWHVVQQKEGRVRPTMQMKGLGVNDDTGLEREADVMGGKAVQSYESLREKEESGRFNSFEHSSIGLPLSDTSVQLLKPGGRPVPIIQRLTIAYTAEDINGTPETAPTFRSQIILQIVHSRDAIPTNVKNIVDGFNDSGGAIGSYKHYVPYAGILKRFIERYEGEDRDTIIEWVTESLEAIDVDQSTFGLNPLLSRAAFQTWLDSAIVAICDWPQNIFRGLSLGDGGGTTLDTPIGASAALSTRLNKARRVLERLKFWS